jgi:hypothetical protein
MSLGQMAWSTMYSVRLAMAEQGPAAVPETRRHETRSSFTVTTPRNVSGNTFIFTNWRSAGVVVVSPVLSTDNNASFVSL